MPNCDSDAQKYLEKMITEEPYSLSGDEKKSSEHDLAAFLAQKLLRKKFRKQKLHQDTVDEFKNKIAAKIKENKPLYFTIPFGGYKHFWNPSHPEPDWAEIFTLRFLAEWLSPLAAAYIPGAVIEFISEDLILARMNNYPKDSLDKYCESFSKLLETVTASLPDNIELKFFRVGDRFDPEAIVCEVEKLLPERWKAWENYNNDEKEIELTRSRRSVMWDGELDLTKLPAEDKEKKIIESRLIELAYYDVEAYPQFLGDYFTEDNRIGICFSFGLSPDNATHWISLGSTYASVVDFWIGRGILEKAESGFVPRIISKQQYDKVKDKLKPCNLKFDKLSSNFQSIEIINATDWAKQK